MSYHYPTDAENAEYQAPSDAHLNDMAMNFFRTCKPKTYRAMRKDGSLEEVLTMRVEATKEYAQGLMRSGEWAGNAWNRAIRLELQESETD